MSIRHFSVIVAAVIGGIAVVVIVLCLLSKDLEKKPSVEPPTRINIDVNDIEAITFYPTFLGHGKYLTEPDDIKLICDFINGIDMYLVDEKDVDPSYGGSRWIWFKFHSATGNTYNIEYETLGQGMRGYFFSDMHLPSNTQSDRLLYEEPNGSGFLFFGIYFDLACEEYPWLWDENRIDLPTLFSS